MKRFACVSWGLWWKVLQVFALTLGLSAQAEPS
jgi:hypothetical protein